MPPPLDRSVVTTDNDTAVGDRVHDVDDEMAALAKTAVVRLDVGLADELRGRYDGVKLGDSGEVELHLTVDADRA